MSTTTLGLASPTVTPHIAAIVLGFLREDGGCPPSGGAAPIIDAAFKLDPQHQAQHAKAWPGIVAAVDLYRSDGGLVRLRAIASGEDQ